MNVLLRETAKKPMKAICDILQVDKAALLAPGRRAGHIVGRVILAWAYDRIGYPVPEIAEKLNRSRSNIYHYLKEAKTRPRSDKAFAVIFDEFKRDTKIF
jgi:hypothetical protein